MNKFRFSYLARRIAALSGRPATFLLALSAVILWGLSGPLFDYSTTWQLIINTATTIITFLMVFIIQNTQNRDTEAMQIKELEEEQLDRYRRSYEKLAREARERLRSGRLDTDSPDIKPLKSG